MFFKPYFAKPEPNKENLSRKAAKVSQRLRKGKYEILIGFSLRGLCVFAPLREIFYSHCAQI